jgi:hypothetical protein
MEKVIKDKTDEVVEKYRAAYAAKGMVFDPLMETMFRQGVTYGISFASLALASVPGDITFNTQGENK